MEARNETDQGQDGQAEQVMQDVGEPEGSSGEVNQSHESDESQNSDPLYVQKRLKQQKRAHDREIRDLQSRMDEMQSRDPQGTQDQMGNPNASSQNDGVDEQIHRAVSYALNHRDMEERKAKDAEKMQHVHKQYGELQKHLDNTADKYDDFDDVVRGQDAPFTSHMRDASLMLPRSGNGSAGEVLYKLGKNRSELKRIAELHPLDQAQEMVKLSHALMSGGDSKQNNQPKTLGQIKSNPVSNSHSISDKTPVSELRRRMKSGWK